MTSSLPSNRLLLVEDERAMAATLAEMLSGEHYLVEVSENGLLARERILRERFDLIILDVMLPGMNGFDICDSVRQEGITTPILVLTARGQTLDKVRGLKLGA